MFCSAVRIGARTADRQGNAENAVPVISDLMISLFEPLDVIEFFLQIDPVADPGFDLFRKGRCCRFDLWVVDRKGFLLITYRFWPRISDLFAGDNNRLSG